MRCLIGMVICLALTSCGGVIAKIDARGNYQQSAAAYRACVSTQGAQACERQRIVMETDERAFTTLSAAVDPDNTTVTVRSR